MSLVGATAEWCVVRFNNSSDSGGGIAVENSAARNCLVTDNGALYGGGIASAGGSNFIENCTGSRNSA